MLTVLLAPMHAAQVGLEIASTLFKSVKSATRDNNATEKQRRPVFRERDGGSGEQSHIARVHIEHKDSLGIEIGAAVTRSGDHNLASKRGRPAEVAWGQERRGGQHTPCVRSCVEDSDARAFEVVNLTALSSPAVFDPVQLGGQVAT